MAGDDEEDEDQLEAPLSEEEMEELENDGDADVALDPRERAARSLEIRRAIEARLEERRMRSALDYLEIEDDDDGADEVD